MNREEAHRGDIDRLVNDPAFERVIETFQRVKLAQISAFESDGSEASKDLLIEWCRQLKTIADLKRTMKNDLSKLSERDS